MAYKRNPLVGFLQGLMGAYFPARQQARLQKAEDLETRERQKEREFQRDRLRKADTLGPIERAYETTGRAYPGLVPELMRRSLILQQQPIPFVEGAGPAPVPEGIANPFAGLDFAGKSVTDLEEAAFNRRRALTNADEERRDQRNFGQQKEVLGLQQQHAMTLEEKREAARQALAGQQIDARRELANIAAGSRGQLNVGSAAGSYFGAGGEPQYLPQFLGALMELNARQRPPMPGMAPPPGGAGPGAGFPPPLPSLDAGRMFPQGTVPQRRIDQGDARVRQGDVRLEQGAERLNLTRQAQASKTKLDERRVAAMEARNSVYARRINSQISNEAFERQMKQQELALDREVKRGRLALDTQKANKPGAKADPRLSAAQKDIDAIQSQRSPLIKQLLGIKPGSAAANQVYAEVRRLDEALETKISERNALMGGTATAAPAGKFKPAATPQEARSRFIKRLTDKGLSAQEAERLANREKW